MGRELLRAGFRCLEDISDAAFDSLLAAVHKYYQMNPNAVTARQLEPNKGPSSISQRGSDAFAYNPCPSDRWYSRVAMLRVAQKTYACQDVDALTDTDFQKALADVHRYYKKHPQYTRDLQVNMGPLDFLDRYGARAHYVGALRRFAYYDMSIYFHFTDKKALYQVSEAASDRALDLTNSFIHDHAFREGIAATDKYQGPQCWSHLTIGARAQYLVLFGRKGDGTYKNPILYDEKTVDGGVRPTISSLQAAARATRRERRCQKVNAPVPARSAKWQRRTMFSMAGRRRAGESLPAAELARRRRGRAQERAVGERAKRKRARDAKRALVSRAKLDAARSEQPAPPKRRRTYPFFGPRAGGDLGLRSLPASARRSAASVPASSMPILGRFARGVKRCWQGARARRASLPVSPVAPAPSSASASASGLPCIVQPRMRRVNHDERFRRDLQEAMRRSLDEAAREVMRRSRDEDEAVREQIERDARLVDTRLQRYGLHRVDTEAVGNCQYAAVVDQLRLPYSYFAFRQLICDLMQRYGFFTKEFVAHNRQEGEFGNELTLRAIATYLQQPIRLVTNRMDESVAEELVEPLESYPANASEFILAYYEDRHYEATASLPP